MRKEYYELHKNEIIEKTKARYRAKRESILQKRKDQYSGDKRVQALARRREAWHNDPGIRVRRDNYWKGIISSAFGVLGDRCAVCSQNDKDILNIDHVDNDGCAERKITSHAKLLVNISKGIDLHKYQILCFNCNLKKSILYTRSKTFDGSDKHCKTCKRTLTFSSFKKHRSYEDGLYYECNQCVATREASIKIQAFSLLGGIRCPCGIDDPDCLTIDHVNEDGGGKRRQWTGNRFYRQVVNRLVPIDDLQVLCLNCNIKKHLSQKTIVRIASKSDSLVTEEPKKCGFRPTLNQSTIDFDFAAVRFGEISGSPGIAFLQEYHYIGYGRHGRKMYGAHIGDQLIAVAKMASPIRQKVASSIGLQNSELLELDRFCIHPAYHKKNFASHLLGKLSRSVRLDFPDIKALVSFADERCGHDGTIYKAANWEFVRMTGYGYTYFDDNGRETNKRTLYGWARSRGMKESEARSFLNLKKITLPRKSKFVYWLRR